MAFIFNKKSQTFKPHKEVKEGTKQYQLKKFAEATLGSGNLKKAVQLPEGEDINEWLAVNTVDFFSIKLICFMEQSPNFVLLKNVL